MSQFDPQKHHRPFGQAQGRRSIRLAGYDYSRAGAYFVTIVTQGRECLFGEVVDEEIKLSSFGQIADECWRAIPEHFPNVDLGVHIVMPNHVHGIIVICEDESPSNVGAQQCCAPTPIDQRDNPHKINVKPGSLGAIVRSFKSAVSYHINKEHNITGIWQRNYACRVLLRYYEHIIRDEREMIATSNYIENNPCAWDDDNENPRRPDRLKTLKDKS